MALDHASSHDSGLVGRVIAGGLRVTDRTGSTPQGILYQAESQDGRPFVLLVLHAQATGLDSGARWFRLASQIGHPNVAAVYAVGELENGSIYAVLEQLEGEPLLQILTAGEALPIGEALDLSLQLAAGLEAAHHQGFIHGSLSPSTVIVTRAPYGKPQVKVVGFNLDPDRQRGSRLDDTSIAYASPERQSGTLDDKRSDVFSVGAVFHHLLTGRPPSGGDLDKAVPKIARPVVAKALAPASTARFQTMSQLRDALEQLAAATTMPPEAKVYRTVLLRAVLAGVAVVVGGLVLAPLWTRLETSRSQTVSLPATVEREPATPNPPPATAPSPASTAKEAPERAAPPRSAPRPRARPSAPSPTADETPGGSQEAESAEAPDVRGYMDQSAAPVEPPPAAERAPAPAPPRATPAAPTKPTSPAPRPRAVLEESQGLRQSIGDVIRIGLAEDVAEASPGQLVLRMAPRGIGVPSALYNLQRLYLAYSSVNRELDSVAIELRQQGRVYGWFTRDGLRYAEPGAEQP